MKASNGFLMLVVAMLMVLGSCSKRDKDSPFEKDSNDITGKWKLIEQGFSPGAGYITEAVPSNPEQLLELKSDNTVKSNIAPIEGFNTYRIETDSTGVEFVSFFKDIVTNYSVAYTIEFEGDDLTLRFRYCIEGCHLKFRRVN